MKKLAIGIDIGGTNTEIGYVDANGNILLRRVLSTITYPEVDNFVAAVAQEIVIMGEELKKNLDFELVGIGLGAPAANFYDGTIENASNLAWKGVIPIVNIFRRHFPSLLITLTNDANGAAMGEMIYGAAKNMKDFITITLGTGVGSGIVSGGNLLYGQRSFAGELGHAIAVPGGRECGCGRRGCLDVYASANGVKRTAFLLLADMRCDSVLRSYTYNQLTSEIVYKAAIGGDKVACEVFEYTGKVLGMALANSCVATFPEAIFLFGGLAKAGDLILEPTRRYLDEYLLINYKGCITVKMSQLNGNNATILGASSLIWLELGSKSNG